LAVCVSVVADRGHPIHYCRFDHYGVISDMAYTHCWGVSDAQYITVLAEMVVSGLQAHAGLVCAILEWLPWYYAAVVGCWAGVLLLLPNGGKHVFILLSLAYDVHLGIS